jgi:hypothetical protein
MGLWSQLFAAGWRVAEAFELTRGAAPGGRRHDGRSETELTAFTANDPPPPWVTDGRDAKALRRSLFDCEGAA